MKRMGYFMGAVSVVFVLMTSYTVNKALAGSGCCDTKEATACEKAENKCPACGKVMDSKDKAVKVEHQGKTLSFCCNGCAEKFKKDPGQCVRDEEQQKKEK
ncbi:MAG: YHS domain-containing protein [Candidatus Brocadia sp.]|nr:YHS domain-containing protein [Candidatus Brocadia sp.]